MKKKKKDNSLIIHAFLLVGFLAIATCLYVMSGKKSATEILQSTEKIYKEKAQVQAPSQISSQSIPKTQKYSYKYTYTINVSGRIPQITFKMPVPYNEKERQYITENTFSIKPTSIRNENGNTIAEFQLNNLNNQSVDISIQGIAEVRTYDYKTASAINKNFDSEKNLEKYTKAEPLIESDDIAIKNAAAKIKGSSREEVVANIYKYVVSNVKYTLVQGNAGAKRTLLQKQGKCSEYAALMVALCRAKNIPARVITGQIAREANTKHNWVEVYYNKYGWVTYEPTKRPTTVTTYNQQGLPVKKEQRIIAESSNINYIASAKNMFSPWALSYSVSQNANGTATVTEKFEIHKL